MSLGPQTKQPGVTPGSPSLAIKTGHFGVWDFDGTEPQRVLEGHTGSVYGVGLTPDVRLAVSGSDDKTLRVWDLEEGKYLAMFTCDAMGLVVRVFAEAHCGWSWAARSSLLFPLGGRKGRGATLRENRNAGAGLYKPVAELRPNSVHLRYF